MTLRELSDTLEYLKKGLAYKLWKQADLITMGVADLLKDKKSKAIFPKTPQEACPELYPPRPSLKIKTPLNKKYKERS
ncbi:MAG TPA: hypothetical protein GX708_15885 [Gallicola sp.]|nr:hypothetical protein [Gallicola sp.]